MTKLETNIHTGLNTTSNTSGSRIVNKSGQPNIKRIGSKFKERFITYHWLISISRFKFIGLVFLTYLMVNLVFALIYFALGPSAIKVHTTESCAFNFFYNCFFFSSQTLTTVGYGHISPISVTANSVAAVESLMGLMMFALITGLIYGRFSKPKSFIKISNVAVIAPFQEGKALMIRIVNPTNYILTDVKANIIIALKNPNRKTQSMEFYPAELEYDNISSLAMNWTIVHPINSDSPFYNKTEEELKALNLEVLLYIKGYDQYYSNLIQTQTSFMGDEIIFGAKFSPMSENDETAHYSKLLVDKLSDYKLL
jgi:inward rectifier potassium channel